MGAMESQPTISCHQMRLPVLGLDCIQLNWWMMGKGFSEKPPKAHNVVKTIGCFPKTDGADRGGPIGKANTHATY